MDKSLQVIGWVGVAAVVLAMLVVTVVIGSNAYWYLALANTLSWAVPAALGFLLVAALGQVLAQLKAIRIATERQSALFQAMIERGGAPK